VSSMFARDDIVPVGRTRSAIWTEASEVKRTDGGVFDVSQAAIWAKGTEASGEVRAGSNAQW